ncbi:MAG TPA: hypothetical protein VFW33_18830 [Gemmataceae bacterium]|nr:hypothetical protein [Gemmataceae bacterium]
MAELRARLADVGEFLKGLDELVRLRNEVAHSAAPDESPVLHAWVGRMTAAVRRTYKSLLLLAEYALVAVEDMDYQDGRFLLSLRRLQGAGVPGPPVRAALPGPYTRGRVYFAAADFSRMQSLHPWVELTQCPLCYQRELFFYVGIRGEEAAYVTPDRGHGWTCPVPAGGPKWFAGP